MIYQSSLCHVWMLMLLLWNLFWGLLCFYYDVDKESTRVINTTCLNSIYISNRFHTFLAKNICDNCVPLQLQPALTPPHTHPYDLHTCCPVTNELHNVACFILFPNTHSNYIVHKIALLSSGVGHTPSHTHTRTYNPHKPNKFLSSISPAQMR